MIIPGVVLDVLLVDPFIVRMHFPGSCTSWIRLIQMQGCGATSDGSRSLRERRRRTARSSCPVERGASCSACPSAPSYHAGGVSRCQGADDPARIPHTESRTGKRDPALARVARLRSFSKPGNIPALLSSLSSTHKISHTTGTLPWTLSRSSVVSHPNSSRRRER